MAFCLNSWYGSIIIPGNQMSLTCWTTEQCSWGRIMCVMTMLGCTDALCFTTHLNSFIRVKLEFWLEVCKYTIINTLFSMIWSSFVFVSVIFYCLFGSFFMLKIICTLFLYCIISNFFLKFKNFYCCNFAFHFKPWISCVTPQIWSKCCGKSAWIVSFSLYLSLYF